MNIEEYITIGRKLAKLEEIQSVHFENNKYYVIFKDWQKGGNFLTIEEAKKVIKG